MARQLDKKQNNSNVQEIRIRFNNELERKLLSCIIYMGKNGEADDLVAKLNPYFFYDPKNRAIYEAIAKVSDDNLGKVDYLLIIEELKRQGKLEEVGRESAIIEIASLESSDVMAEVYYESVKSDYLARELIKTCREIIGIATVESKLEVLKAEAENRILDLGNFGLKEGPEHLYNPTSICIQDLQDEFAMKKKPIGIKSGFRQLDKVLNGFKPQQYIVIAARPGCGKTAFALNIVCNNLPKSNNSNEEKKNIVIFNQEMASTEIADRILANLVKENRRSMEMSRNAEALDKCFSVLSIIKESNIYVDDTAGITPEEIASRCRRLKKQLGKLDLVIIDYLQLLTIKSTNRNMGRQQEVATISRQMKIMAKQLNVPVIVLSQLSRDIEKRENANKKAAPENPKLSDLRDSGAIEQDADVVMFLYNNGENDDNNAKNVKLAIAKHRNGELRDINYIFNGATMTFTEANNITGIPSGNDNNNDKIKEEEMSENVSNMTDIEIPDYDPLIETQKYQQSMDDLYNDLVKDSFDIDEVGNE